MPSIRISPSCGSNSRGTRSINALLPLAVAPTTPIVAPAGAVKLMSRNTQRGGAAGFGRIVKADVSETRATVRRVAGRQRARRRGLRRGSELRVEDVEQARHRRRAALEEVDHPAERDERPRQHAEVHAERHERADGDRAAHARPPPTQTTATMPSPAKIENPGCMTP